jgi:hypothetical protein
VGAAPDRRRLDRHGCAARRSRALSVVSGLALLAGSLLQRLGIFEAGVASTKDPRYVIVPQRQRANDRLR